MGSTSTVQRLRMIRNPKAQSSRRVPSLDILTEVEGERLGRVVLLLAIHPNQTIGMLVPVRRISHIHVSRRADRRGERDQGTTHNVLLSEMMRNWTLFSA
jgi:hypothetical protein